MRFTAFMLSKRNHGQPHPSGAPNRQDLARFRLQDRNYVNRLDIPFVLGFFIWRKRTFIGFAREFVDPGLCLRIGPKLDESFCNIGRQAPGNRVQKSIQRAVKYRSHIGIISPAVAAGNLRDHGHSPYFRSAAWTPWSLFEGATQLAIRLTIGCALSIATPTPAALSIPISLAASPIAITFSMETP
jgi:hypothetical protein